MKLLFIYISKLLLVYICCFSLNAKDIVIGASLNLTGVNARYSTDYKNAKEAYIESYHKLDKLKKYQLKLLVLDEQGIVSRSSDNIERLITSKQVIAILNPYLGVVGNKIIQAAVNLETLVLSPAFASKGARDTKAKKRYSYYFSTLDFFSHQVVNQLFAKLSISSDKLFYFTDKKIIERIKTVDKYTENYLDKPITDLPEGTVIIIRENYAEAVLFINEAVKQRTDLHFIIQPNIGADSLIDVVILPFQVFERMVG